MKNKVNSRFILTIIGLVLLRATTSFAPPPACPPIINVTTTADSGPGSLRDAIALANSCGGPRTIVLSNVTYSFTNADNFWYGSNALPLIATDITIEGNGAIIERATNAPNFRLFYVSFGDQLTLRDVTLRGGFARGDDGGAGGEEGLGGAILNDGMTVLEGVTAIGNTARGGDGSLIGGPGLGGAIYVRGGTLTVDCSTFTSNSATGGLGPNTGGGYGGAIATSSMGSARSFGSAFHGNTASSANNDVFGDFVQESVIVVNTNDSGAGSLRQAILDANDCAGQQIIEFATNAYGTITLTSGELLIADDLEIRGPGATNVTVSGNHSNRVFNIGPGNTVTMAGLTISNGHEFTGGGINNSGATLTLSSCIVSGNSATTGGGINNSASGPNSIVTLSVINSTLSGNSAGTGGAIHNIGQIGSSSTVRIVNSTLSGNSATSRGGGIANFGTSGGDQTATVIIHNSTLSGNSAGGDGGGILNFETAGTATVEMGSTILNASPIDNSGTTPVFTSLGYNLSSDGAAGVLNQSTDQINKNPLLGPLQFNGGPTPTHALVNESLIVLNPAVDKGTNFDGLATDQRGMPRTFGPGTDIGAFERQANHCPTVSNQSTNVSFQGSIFIDLPAADLDGDILSYSIVSPPTNFSLFSLSGNRVHFVADTNCGPDGFTWKANDANCFSATATVTLNVSCVNSNHAPVASCTNVTVSAGTNCTANASINNGSADPDGDPITSSQSPAGPYPRGTNNVTLWVVDNHGASNSCVAQVIVRDTTPPTINCTNITVSLNAAGTVSITPSQVFASGSDNCGTVILASVTPSSFACANLGSNSVTLRAHDGHGNTNSCVTTVMVRDTTPPILNCSNITVNLSAAGTASITPSQVFGSGSDNCGTVSLISVTPSSFTCANLGSNSVTLRAHDGHGNTNTCVATVIVRDATPPILNCTNITVSLNAVGTVSITPSQVFRSGSDNCGTVSLISVTPSSFTCANLGSNSVTLRVHDGHGNTNSCVATVVVRDTTPPILNCSKITVNLSAAGTASITPSQVFGSGSDNCGTVSLISVTPSSFTCANLGSNSVTLRAHDGHGNTNSCVATVTVRDTNAPVITLKPAISVKDNSHMYRTFNLTDFVASVTDTCSGLSVSNCVISQVTSDEPDNTPDDGDGNTRNDMVIAAGCKSVQLMQERDGSKNGRVYKITIKAKDASGNVGQATTSVSILLNSSGAPAVDSGVALTVTGCNP